MMYRKEGSQAINNRGCIHQYNTTGKQMTVSVGCIHYDFSLKAIKVFPYICIRIPTYTIIPG